MFRERLLTLSIVHFLSDQLLSTPILEELAITWSPDFARSVPRRFREIERGISDASRAGDLHASWFGPLFLVERAREAMLWSWAVARLGGIDGMWGGEERNEVRRVLKIEGMAEEPKNVWVDAYSREKRPGMGWIDLKGKLDEMGVDGPMVTEMLWCESVTFNLLHVTQQLILSMWLSVHSVP